MELLPTYGHLAVTIMFRRNFNATLSIVTGHHHYVDLVLTRKNTAFQTVVHIQCGREFDRWTPQYRTILFVFHNTAAMHIHPPAYWRFKCNICQNWGFLQGQHVKLVFQFYIHTPAEE